MVNGNLPDGWEWSTIGELAERVTKGSTPTSYGFKYQREGIKFVKTENIVESGKIQSITDYIDDETNRFLSRSILQPFDILFSIAGTIGRVGIVQEHDVPANTNQALSILRGVHKKANFKYVFYFLKSPFVQKQALDSIVGVGRANLSLANVSGLKIPLAPLPEQERIVAKIEELFTQLEAGTAALERVQAGLKRYKASVLKAAVEGKLLKDEGRRMKDEGQLPAGWKWVTLGEITQHLTSGSRGWAKYYSEEGSLFVRVGNFNRLSNTIDLTKLQLVNAPDTAEANRTRLKERDLLITMTADVGMVGIVDERTLHWGNAYINQHVGLVRLKNPDYVDYVSWALASEIGQKQFRAKQYGLTKVGLNFDDIRSLEIPLPPLEEQRQIVAEVERRLSLAAGVESTLAASLSRAGRLRQSILKSAFEGRLV